MNPFLDADTGYKAQALVVEHRVQAGEHLIGAKLGFTSKVKRLALGIHEPVYGQLTSSMVVPYGEPVRLAELIHPRAEPEIAFLIGERIEPSTPPAGVLAAIDAVIPAIEVMDSPRRLPVNRLRPDNAARHGSCSARKADGQTNSGPSPPGLSVQISRRVRDRGRRRGDGPSRRRGGVAGNALAAHGQSLEAGSIVLSGGLTASTELRPGAVASAEFDGLGTVRVHCC